MNKEFGMFVSRFVIRASEFELLPITSLSS